MKFRSVLLIGVSGLLSANLMAAEDVTPEVHQAAVHVAVTTCATCHGPQGRSISPKFPRLAGQKTAYLATQMNNFKSHTRGDPDALGYMYGMAAPLDDDLIAGLAAYYSAQRPAAGQRSDPDAVTRGKGIYAEGVVAHGVPACATCHGPNAAGLEDFPRLAGQSSQYIVKQLHSFQNNLRNVAVMHVVTSGLTNGEMTDVAAYLQSLGP